MKYTIGDWVQSPAFVSLYYDEHDHKKLYRQETEEPMIGQVCGAVRRCLGQYVKTSRDEDYEPPSLNVTEILHLYEVRLGLSNRPLLMREEDLIKVRNVGGKPLPLVVKKPKLKPFEGDVVAAEVD